MIKELTRDTASNAAKPTKKPEYFPALTGVRAIAALLVFIYHYVADIPMDNLPEPAKWGYRFLHQGHIGVNIFFVLSGFLISVRYSKNLILSGSWFRRYMQNRFARIYPIYFLLTVLTFAVMVMHPLGGFYEWRNYLPTIQGKSIAIILNLTLTRAYFEDLRVIGLPTAWTLTIEETFYLLAPFLLLGLAYSRRLLYIYPIFFIALGLALVPICQWSFPHLGFMESTEFMLAYTFFGRCTEFIAGIGLSMWLRKHPFSTNRYTTASGIIGLILGMAALAILADAHSDTSYWFLAVSNLLLPVPIVLLFWGLITEQTLVRRVLESKFFDLLGKSSYAFYLIHLGVIDTLFNMYVTDNWLARLVSHTILSILIYKYLEHPLHKRLRSKQPAAISKTT